MASRRLLGRRAAAWAIDSLLALSPLFLLLPLLLPMLEQSPESSLIARTVFISAVPLFFIIYYFMVFAGAWSGKESVGRRLMKLETVYQEGKSLFVRYMLLGLLPMLLLYILGLLPLILIPLLLPLLSSTLSNPLDRFAGINVCPKN